MRTDRRAGIAHISFPKEQRPEALAPQGPCAFRDQRSRGEANKAVLPVAACPLRCQLAEPQCLIWAQSAPQLPPFPQRTQRGRSPGRGRGGGSKRPRLPSTVLDALQPLPSQPATPTLAPPPPVAACPSSLFLSPHFASWGSEDQIPPARPPPHELPGLGARAPRSRPVHRGQPTGSSTRPAALNFSPGRCAGLGAEGRARPGEPFPQGCLARRVTLGSPFT